MVGRKLEYLLLTLLSLLFIAPVLVMIAGSFKPDARVLTEAGSLQALLPDDPTLDNYRELFQRTPFSRYLLNSLLINTNIVLFGLLVNSLAGYALARLRWPGRSLLLSMVILVLVIPFESIAIPLFYQLTSWGWRDTYIAQIAPFVATPLSIYLFYSFFLGMPRELEEAAWVDGAGYLRTFLTIVVPNSKPVFASVAIVTLLFYWGLYIWPLLMTAGEEVRPLPLGIATFYTLPPLAWGDILAFGVLMVAPVLLVFLFFQRWFVSGIATTGIKG
jgi:multiple sugar transport system permease protein